MKEAAIRGSCEVDCVSPLKTGGPHWTHRDSNTLIGAPRPMWPAKGLLFSCAFLLFQTPRHRLSSGLVPCSSPDIFLKSLPKCLLLSEASPDLFEICTPPPPPTAASTVPSQP